VRSALGPAGALTGRCGQDLFFYVGVSTSGTRRTGAAAGNAGPESDGFCCQDIHFGGWAWRTQLTQTPTAAETRPAVSCKWPSHARTAGWSPLGTGITPATRTSVRGLGLPLPRTVTERGAARRGGLLPSLVTVPGCVPGAVEEERAGCVSMCVMSWDGDVCICACVWGSVLVCGQGQGCLYVWVCAWGSGVGGLGLSTSQVYQVSGR
jgi:hypothetical protein